MAIRKRFRPLSGQICEIVKFIWSGKFHIRQGKVREFQKPLICGNHINILKSKSVLKVINCCLSSVLKAEMIWKLLLRPRKTRKTKAYSQFLEVQVTQT